MRGPEPYYYKAPKKSTPRMPTSRLIPPKVDEELTGIVHAQEASDIEERFARSLYKKKIDFRFQVLIPTTTQFEDKTLDFLVIAGTGFPIEIDGNIGHKTEKQKARDAIKEAYINEWAMKNGYSQLQRVPGDELATQELADLIVGELFG